MTTRMNNAVEPDLVHTVDSFQGSEAAIVLLSFVRSSQYHGFLNEFRRLNVALSRAQHQLIIFANVGGLLSSRHSSSSTNQQHKQDNEVSALLRDAKERGCVVDSQQVLDFLEGRSGGEDLLINPRAATFSSSSVDISEAPEQGKMKATVSLPLAAKTDKVLAPPPPPKKQNIAVPPLAASGSKSSTSSASWRLEDTATSKAAGMLVTADQMARLTKASSKVGLKNVRKLPKGTQNDAADGNIDSDAKVPLRPPVEVVAAPSSSNRKNTVVLVNDHSVSARVRPKHKEGGDWNDIDIGEGEHEEQEHQISGSVTSRSSRSSSLVSSLRSGTNRTRMTQRARRQQRRKDLFERSRQNRKEREQQAILKRTTSSRVPAEEPPSASSSSNGSSSNKLPRAAREKRARQKRKLRQRDERAKEAKSLESRVIQLGGVTTKKAKS
ncbi:unnamed protein product [Amoebophrya sp. A25]|nr:unnamed protein product [Amoebophrya sp. A25]|eukprot:GSA25T00010133001.1